MHPEVNDDDDDEAEHDSDEDDEIDEDDDGDGEEMTLAQGSPNLDAVCCGGTDLNHYFLVAVVAEWSVENVCVWLKEDVGVGEVVVRLSVPKLSGHSCDIAMLLQILT